MGAQPVASRPLGPSEASGQPAVWLRLCVSVRVMHVSRQASAQEWDGQSSTLGLENTSRAPQPLGLRVCLQSHQGRLGPVREGKLLSLSVCHVPGPVLLVGLGGWEHMQPRGGRARATHSPPRVLSLRGPLRLSLLPLQSLLNTGPPHPVGGLCWEGVSASGQSYAHPSHRKYISVTSLFL